jgi:glycosyltransferase involved in cell wall biosynthesis
MAVRILHVVTAFPRSPDDVITPWLVELVRRLRARGLEAEVFTSAYQGGGPTEFDGIPVYRFRYFFRRWENLTHEEAAPDRLKRSWRYRLMALCYVVAGTLAMWRRCRRVRYDIVHVHWAMPHALFGWVARWACGARIVITFYGVELRWTATSLWPLRWFLARAARSCDRAVAISSYTAEEVRRLGRADVPVIPYATGLPADEGEHPARSEGRFTVLFVGRLVERKGVQVLLEAMRRMPSDLACRAVIVGEGPARDRLRELARALGLSDAVTFTGRIGATALQAAYRASDALVLPAVVDRRGDTEGLGVVLLEAMHYGVPVIGSQLGGIRDIIEHERSGLLVPPGDASALALAMERLARDPALARRLGEAGRRRVREHFSWPVIASRWVALYTELAAGPV